MEQLIVQYSKRRAPEMPDYYHQETARLMIHMIELAIKKGVRL